MPDVTDDSAHSGHVTAAEPTGLANLHYFADIQCHLAAQPKSRVSVGSDGWSSVLLVSVADSTEAKLFLNCLGTGATRWGLPCCVLASRAAPAGRRAERSVASLASQRAISRGFAAQNGT